MKCLIFLFALASLTSVQAETAQQLLERSQTTGGLVVHLNCGDGKLLAEIAEGRPSILVHGLDADPGNVQKARTLLRDSTRASVELWTRQDRLPHSERLVTLLIADGDSGWLTDAEALRVLSPNGVLLRRDGDAWKTLRNDPSDPSQDWTHYQFDASNNMVGTDKEQGLPRQFQWAGKPLWTTSHENMSSVNAMVSANGRVFAIVDEGPRASIQLPADWQLVARDAYNGVVLWRQPIGNWLTRFWPWKSGPAQMPRKLVAVGDRVYAPLDVNGELMQFDAASGEVIQTYAGTAAAEEIVFVDGVLLVVVNPDPSNLADVEEERRKRRHFSYDGRNRVVIDHDKAKRVVALDAESGEMLWERVGPRVSPLSLGSIDGKAVYHDGEHIVCLDLKTGEEKWKSDPIPEQLKMIAEEAPTLVLSKDAVFYARSKKITTVSMADGKLLWTTPWVSDDYRSPVSVMLMQGKVWSMNITQARAPGTFIGRDPLTGEIKTQFDLPPFAGIGHHRCYKAKASGDFVMLSRSGVEYVNPAKPEEYKEHHWVRGACLYGIMPSNGMLISTPHACACYIKGKLNGFTAMTTGPTGSMVPEEGGDPVETTLKDVQVEQGGVIPITDTDWPTYRGQVDRSGRNSTKVEADLRQAWRTNVGGELSSVTVGSGLVFVAQKDRNTIFALSARTGDVAWAFTAGGTIDSPPTVTDNRVYFGSADGCVYCLRSHNGELVWRTRAAPTERKVIAYGRLESAWPVSGSVVVQQGAVFAAAGRSSFLDGGIRIVKIDAGGGKILNSQVVYDLDEDGNQPEVTASFEQDGALPDVLSSDGGSVYMRHLRFETEVLKPAEPKPHLFSPTGYLDANRWHRTYWVYGENTKAGYGGWWQSGNELPAGRIMVFDDETVYAFGRSFYAGMNSAQFGRGEKYILYAADKKAGAALDVSAINDQRKRRGDLGVEWDKVRTTPIRWSQQLPFDVRAMALAKDTLFIAGPYGDAVRSVESFEGKRGSRIAAANIKTGELISSFEIDALPVFDALAAANGQLFCAFEDGSVRAFGETGTELLSKLGEPIEVLPEDLEPSDEAYRKQTQELLGRPVGNAGKGKGKGKGAKRKPIPGKSSAAEFDLVRSGKIVSSDLGYRLGAGEGKVAVALRQIDEPVTTRATWKFKLKQAEGFPNPPFSQNGFLVFGDGDSDEQLLFCGIQFVRGTFGIFEGSPSGSPALSEALEGEMEATFEAVVTVDLEKQEVTLKIGEQNITKKLKRKIEAVSRVGFGTWNAVTDFEAQLPLKQ
ncbi:MAG: outer membrane protein assembly factor BamB [Verrucomicrobiales bacterium]|jgi:outer membrane protein assembly factor BamB